MRFEMGYLDVWPTRFDQLGSLPTLSLLKLQAGYDEENEVNIHNFYSLIGPVEIVLEKSTSKGERRNEGRLE